jgi:Secretion system C-terminal sorting domain
MVYGQYDTLLYSKVTYNHISMGSFGSTGEYEVYYSIWEDSISGNIQLFGKKYLYPIGGVNDVYSPSNFTLYQNYPNPFNPGTIINFKLLHRDNVTLNVYDIMGRLVCTLLNEVKPAGDYSIKFDSEKFNLPSGIYFYRLISGTYSAVKKMILLK